jgi:CheY-like chemotaxis protein
VDENAQIFARTLRVFLVDDLPLGLRLMERCLGFTDECNFEVVGTASNGVEALTRIPAAAPQLLITGLEMPQMDGIELTRKVRHSFPRIRVLVTSATHQEEEADRALQAGAHEYCAKASLVAALTKELELLRNPKVRSKPPARVATNLAEQMFGGLLFSSAAGLAIFDKSLRYQFINPALAAINGVPAREHLNKTVREVMGDLADILEPKFQQVFQTGKPLLNLEIVIKLRNRTKPGKWIEDAFPITDLKGNVTHLAVVVVEASLSGSAREITSLDPVSGDGLSLIDPVRIFRSWKEIAIYASTSVRTAQRWERDFELPVRRLRTERGLTVMAFKSDLDRWLAASAQLPNRIMGDGQSQVALGSPTLWRASAETQTSKDPTQVLRSWKSIARYLAASIRTTQRWERELELPVLRVKMKLGVAVVAFKADLDEWLRSRGIDQPSVASASHR